MTAVVVGKACSRCGAVKPLEEFNRQSAAPDGYQPWCKPCFNAYRRVWVEENRDKERAKYRRFDLMSDFGITIEQYDELLAAQDGVCAVCRKKCKSGRNLAVDHDHATGVIRGLLCSNCNRGLGCFQDSNELLAAAAVYLAGRR